MYTYFTKDTPTNFIEKNRTPEFVENISTLSRKAKSLYAYLLEKLSINNKKQSTKLDRIKKWFGYATEEECAYIEVTRKNMAGYLECALGTLRNVINELKLHGLISDVRMGLNKTNRIFLKYRKDARLKFTENKKSDTSSAKPVPHSPSSDCNHIEDGNNNQIRDIVSHIGIESLPSKEIKSLRKLTKLNKVEDQVKDIDAAVDYCIGKEVKTTPLQMLYDTLRNGYHRKKPKSQSQSSGKASKPKPKNPHFTTMYSHNWNLEELERREREYIENKIYGDKE